MASVTHRARSTGAFVISRAGSHRAWRPLPGRVQARNHLSCTAPRPGWLCRGQVRRPATSVLPRSSPAGSGYSSRAAGECPDERLPAWFIRSPSVIDSGPMATLGEGSQPCRGSTRGGYLYNFNFEWLYWRPNSTPGVTRARQQLYLRGFVVHGGSFVPRRPDISVGSSGTTLYFPAGLATLAVRALLMRPSRV